jgi:hypothetical protein
VKEEVMKYSLPIFLFFMALASPAMASTTWYVNGVNGNDKNNCKSPQQACKTIGHAISLASSGDSIMVAPATYTESLTLSLNLKIVGSGAATTIIDGYQGVFMQDNSAIVTLSGLTVRKAIGGIGNLGTLTINDSTISGNANAGGIYNGGTLTLNRCTVSGNRAIGMDSYYSEGGGIDNYGILTVNDSTISKNTALGDYVCGGGIYNAGTLTINNSTLYRNYTNGDSNSVGGGIDNEGGTVVLNNSTLSGNKATAGSVSGGGVSNGGCGTSGTMTLRNSIVANSPEGGNCGGSITSQGYNLSSDKTCNFNGPGDLNNTVPKLGKLGNYGGPTQTIPLLFGSPAIDAGNPNGCTDRQGRLLKTDQRGKPRPDKEDNGIGCDMGAYERQSD